MTDEVTKDESKDKPELEKTPDKKQKSIGIVPRCMRIDPDDLTRKAGPQPVLFPYQGGHQSPVRLTAMVPISMPAEREPEPLMTFRSPPPAPKGLMPVISRPPALAKLPPAKLPGKMPKTKLI
jgi:hypothetical protein